MARGEIHFRVVIYPYDKNVIEQLRYIIVLQKNCDRSLGQSGWAVAAKISGENFREEPVQDKAT